MRILILSLVLLIIACNRKIADYVVTIEKHEICSVYRVKPANVTEEAFPQYRVVLDNGDTLPFNINSKPGDTIIYKIYERKSNRDGSSK